MAAPGASQSYALPIPAFSDVAKSANDLLNKDFYHVAAADLQVKLKTPNGVNVTVKGKNTHDNQTSGSVEGKYMAKPQGINFRLHHLSIPVHRTTRKWIQLDLWNVPCRAVQKDPSFPSSTTGVILTYHNPGITVTQGWTTSKLLDTKIELDNTITQGVKTELQNLFSPEKGDLGQKINLHFKQSPVHARAFIDRSNSGNISAVVDAVAGHEGFLVGGEAGYDVSKAAITRYSAALAYQTPVYTAALTGTSNLQVFAASYYHKVNSQVEAGAKTTYDTKAGNVMGLELATKYKLDGASFAKAKVNDQGIAALAYNTKVNSGLTFGVGLSLDTKKLNEASHKVGTSFVFEG
ncbi:MAG: hypothetical protein M1820_004272 [Bogoriella megaspora]|nr:MAG: hypothetical protein M1820_004272 [Bogoriella megaspora]